MPMDETGAKHIPAKHEIDLVVDAKCVCRPCFFVCAVPPHLGLAMGSAAKHGDGPPTSPKHKTSS